MRAEEFPNDSADSSPCLLSAATQSFYGILQYKYRYHNKTSVKAFFPHHF